MYDLSKRVYYEIVSVHCLRKIKCHYTFALKVLLITSAINSKKGNTKCISNIKLHLIHWGTLTKEETHSHNFPVDGNIVPSI